MNISELAHALSDERCGLYFLAGLDGGTSGDSARIVTVHLAERTVDPDQVRFIEDAVRRIDPGLDVSIVSHSTGELHAPDSLESFAGLFYHDRILADPTGAFARGSELLALARGMRAELGGSLNRILWRAEDAALIVVAAASATHAAPSGKPAVLDDWSDNVRAIVDWSVSADLKRVIRSVRIVAEVPSGRYVPVDKASVVAPVRRGNPVGILARIASVAAMLGLGTVAAAAGTGTDDGQLQAPGITALAGLTTLGENSVGVRNHYQAVGGLRLYFGETGLLLASAAGAFSTGMDGVRGTLDTWPAKRVTDVSG